MLSCELFPKVYNVHRSDRKLLVTNYTTGGGVLLACKDSIKSERVNLPLFESCLPSIDILCCKCIINFSTIFVFVVYVPPNTTLDNFELFFETLEQLNFVFGHHVLILGDFNVSQFVSGNINDRKASLVKDFATFFNFQQFNTILNDSGRLLDLVFSNNHCEVLRESAPFVIEDSYHPSLFIKLQIKSKFINFSSHKNHKAYNFKKANFPGLYNALLDSDWYYLQNFDDVNLALDSFYDKLYQIFDKYVPQYKSYNRQYPKWYTADIISNIRKKYKHFEKYKTTNSRYHLQEFKKLRTIIKEQISSAYSTYINSIQSSISSDPKYFWSYIQSKRQQTRIPAKMSYNGIEYDNPRDIVNTFATFFSDVFSMPSSNDNDDLITAEQNSQIINIGKISITEIQDAIKKLKNKMTAGIDLIPSFIVKDCASVLCIPMFILFNLSLKTCEFPNTWKIARVCPVFKNGDLSLISNYRAISILNNFAKVFEIVLYNRIHLSIKLVISPNQHGFMANRSTISNLVLITQYISDNLDDQGQVDTVYTDFSKAFDRIDHTILLKKMSGFGFSLHLTQFFESYLGNRQQFVFYNGYKSTVYTATSGVPQGSNLGPLLFLLFINDLCTELECESLMFADDLKLFKKVSSELDCIMLQNDLNTIHNWCNVNQLALNASKCKIVSYTRKHNSIQYPYKIDGIDLERLKVIKDLGITFDSELTFVSHINIKIAEATKLLGFIIRNCKDFSNIKALQILYCSFVRSKLEYGSIIWNPYYLVHKTALEGVQRKFLKFLAFKATGAYPERGINHNILLNNYNMESLEMRRYCCLITFLYKLLHNQIDCSAILYQINFHIPRLHSRQNPTFYCRQAKTNVMLKSPVRLMCESFNKLCHNCDIYFCKLEELLGRAKENF